MRLVGLLLTVLIAFTIQSTTGFGGALIAMPIAIQLIGLAPARVVINAISWITATIVTIVYRKDINRKKLLLIVTIMFVGILLGQAVEKYVQQKRLYLIYGLCIICIALWNFRKKTSIGQKQLPALLKNLLLLLAGVLHGIFVSGGGFLLIYARYEFPDKKEFRATSCAAWAVLNIYIIINQIRAGFFTSANTTLLFQCLIPGICSIFLAKYIFKRINQKAFEFATNLLVLGTGFAMVLNAF